MKVMHKKLFISFLFMSGCTSIYNPLISHKLSHSDIQSYDVSECVALPIASLAVKRACLTRDAIEGASGQHIWTHSLTTNLLIPAAGVVAYRAARQGAAAPSIAIAAAGIATYETVGALAPDNRVEAYNRGSNALTCALGEYVTGVSSANIPITEQKKFYDAIDNVNAKIKDIKDNGATANRAHADDVEKKVSAIYLLVTTNLSTGLADAQMDKFVGQTVDDLNDLLRGTLPTLSSLGKSIEILQNASVPQSKEASVDAFKLEFTISDTELQSLNNAFSDLQSAAKSLLAAQGNDRISLDLSHCLMATTALTSSGLYQPFALGPGNSKNGASINVPKDANETIAIVGGQAPYSVNIKGSNAASDISNAPTTTITMQGQILLQISSKHNAATDLSYIVEVYDSLGSKRSITVVIPHA